MPTAVQTNSPENILIAAATITSELSKVRKIAREMSLGVMNAKAISSRAGEAARGFQPITDFIDEMAHEVMQLVTKISHQALRLSRFAVRRNHIRKTLGIYQQVIQKAGDAPYSHSLDPVIAKLENDHVEYRNQLISNIRTLKSLLDDINYSTRGAQVISTTSRVEASQAGEYRKSLEVVADNLEQASEKIRLQVKNSQNRLQDVISSVMHED